MTGSAQRWLPPDIRSYSAHLAGQGPVRRHPRCPEMKRATCPDPITSGLKLVSEEKSRSWGLMCAGVFRRAPGEVVWQSDYYRISCVLSDMSGAKQIDGGPVEEYRLRPGDIAFRPRDRKLWSDLSGGRFIQILQSRETYDNLVPELVRGGSVHLDPHDAFSDPLISQIAVRLPTRSAAVLLMASWPMR